VAQFEGRERVSWQAEAIFQKAMVALRGHAYDRASDLLVEVIKLQPDFVEAWIARGNILLMQQRSFDATMHYDQAIRLRQTAYDAWNNRGEAYSRMGMWEQAEHSFKQSAMIMPAVEPHLGAAGMYCTLMRLDDAVAEYRAAIALEPANCDAHFNLGVTLLGLGQWEEGWREYEWRWLNDPHPPAAYRNFPKWRGEDLAGKTILLYPEQGYGDEILAARFAHAVRAAHGGPRVVLEARAPFARLARVSTLADEVVVRGDPYADGIDYSCPLLDVPMVTGLPPALVKMLPNYLCANNVEQVGMWRERLSALPGRINVGLCWGSGRHLETTRGARDMKSIPIELLSGLDIDSVNLVSLQKPREPVPTGLRISDWTDEIYDLADTADMIAALDLVISVDTAVAHLAGALGKQVWNFVRFSGYWPWLAGSGEHSIWYPSNMKLLRQPKLGDWNTPITKAVAMLRDMTMEKAA
jgi:Tfp pilus assembly protein PilF